MQNTNATRTLLQNSCSEKCDVQDFVHPFGETTLLWITDGSKKKVLLRSKHKSAEQFVVLMSQFCKVEVMVLDACTGAITTAKACLQLVEKRRIIERVKDSACF